MNKTVKIVLIAAVALVVVGGLGFAGLALWGWRNTQFSRQTVPGYGYGPMMPGHGWDGRAPGFSRGPMMPGYGRDGRGQGFGYGPMMGGGAYGPRAYQNIQPLTVDEAKQTAQKYVDSLGINNLSVGEVMIFDNNAYVAVNEADTGLGAFELLVDPVSKTAYPEPGADMMWNLKYGAVNQAHAMGGRGMGWMMGGITTSANPTPAAVSAEMPISADQAVKAAQAFLDQRVPGATAATDPIQFYGYYTLDYSKDGKIFGMLSVNGYNGEILLHVWHGGFVEESK